MLAALADVEHPHDLDVLARAYAPGAQDARAHVVADHRVARALVAVAEREVAPPHGRRHDSVTDCVLLELIARLRAAAVDQVVAGIALE